MTVDDFEVCLFAGDKLRNAFRSRASLKARKPCQCQGINDPLCLVCSIAAAVVRVLAACIGDVTEEFISLPDAGTGKIVEIKPRLKEGAEPLSKLAEQLRRSSDRILFVVTMTEDLQVQCFTGEKALDVMKSIPEKIVLRRYEGFAMPDVWCPVPAAIGEAVTAYLGNIAKDL